MWGRAMGESVFIGFAKEIGRLVDIAYHAGILDRDARDRILREQCRGAAIARAAPERRQVRGAEDNGMPALAAVSGYDDPSRAATRVAAGRDFAPFPRIGLRDERADGGRLDPGHVG